MIIPDLPDRVDVPLNEKEDDKFARIMTELTENGFSVCDGFVSANQLSEMVTCARKLWNQHEFRRAQVGQGATLGFRPEIRSDYVMWVDTEHPKKALLPYFLDLETLRRQINRHFYLGLFELEAHFALYPPGAFYDIHYDRFIGSTERVVTCILYLNDDWLPEHGGALKVHEGIEPSSLTLPMEVQPLGGRLVCFFSELFPHEVLPAQRERLSLTGWFRIRS